MGQAHHTAAYRKARAALLARAPQPCALCSGWIDYHLTYPDPWSATAEHVIAARDGGDHTTLLPAHLDCQRRQGGIAATARDDEYPPPRTSGVW